MVQNKSAKLLLPPQLPDEIILEILSRLPTKSLGLLRSYFVAKFPHLSKRLQTLGYHRLYASNNVLNNLADQKLFIPSSDCNFIDEIDPFACKRSLSDNTSCVIQNYDFQKLFKDDLPYETKKFSKYKLIGSSYGLICLYFEFFQEPKMINRKWFYHFLLWNPCTGERHVLPIIPQGFDYIIVCGFAYDDVNKTFKIVIAKGRVTQIYDLSKDIWRIVDTTTIGNWNNFSYIKAKQKNRTMAPIGKYLNGALPWIGSCKEILSIDLSTEVISRLTLPSVFNKPEEYRLQLGVLQGCLSILVNGGNVYRSVWVMKEYGRKESWTYTFTLSLMAIQMDLRPPIWVSPSEEIMLFLIDGRLAYMSDVGSFRYVKGVKFSPKYQGIFHVDTVVSPKPYQSFRL